MSPGRPILYSFRRCPYAIRARLAIWRAEIPCELREVELSDKPPSMVEHSAKGTVPVLVLADGTVIDESLEVMLWALDRSDPDAWLTLRDGDLAQMLALIEVNDNEFKSHLDRYKYPNRYVGVDPLHHRNQAMRFLDDLDQRILANTNLFGARPGLADFAILPFVRQFANTDRAWFDAARTPALQDWLSRLLETPLFQSVMVKYQKWRAADELILVP